MPRAPDICAYMRQVGPGTVDMPPVFTVVRVIDDRKASRLRVVCTRTVLCGRLIEVDGEVHGRGGRELERETLAGVA